MRKLHVDLSDIAMAMESGDSEHAWYLDRESGCVVLVPVELQGEDVLDAKYCDRLPPWEQAGVPQAREIYLGSDRYVSVRRESPRGEYELMLGFAESVPDSALQALLLAALDGPGAFGRFQRALDRHPAERDAWDRQRQEFPPGACAYGSASWASNRLGMPGRGEHGKPRGPKGVRHTTPLGAH